MARGSAPKQAPSHPAECQLTIVAQLVDSPVPVLAFWVCAEAGDVNLYALNAPVCTAPADATTLPATSAYPALRGKPQTMTFLEP